MCRVRWCVPPHKCLPDAGPSTSLFRTTDGHFLSEARTCELCTGSAVTTSLLVPAAVGVGLVGVAASCIHPATWRRYVAMGEWFRIQEGKLLSLQGKANLFFTLGQTVSFALVILQKQMIVSNFKLAFYQG